MKKLTAALLLAALLLQASVLVHAAPLAHAQFPSSTAISTSALVSSPYGFTITGDQFTRTTLGTNGVNLPPVDFQNIGVTWARVQIHMDELFPYQGSSSPDPSVGTNYTWTVFDQAMMNAQSNGLLVDYPLQQVPSGSYNGQPFQDSCGNPTAYVLNAYVTAIMNHLRYNLFVHHPELQGTIRTIEIGNEDWSFSQNGSSCINDPTTYAQIVESVAPKIRNLSSFMTPQPLVGSFGYTNFGKVDDSAQERSVNYFWQNFYAYKASPTDPGPASRLDYVNFHYYHSNYDPDTPIPPGVDPKYPHGQDTFKTVYQAIQTDGAAYQNYNGQRIPIWVTETGWRINQNCDSTVQTVTPSEESSYERTMLDESRLSNNTSESNGGVTHLFIFTADEYFSNCGYTGADISNDGNWQPAGTMLHNYIQNHSTWP